MKRLLLVLALLFVKVAIADPAGDKIAAGRAALVAHDLPTAYARFQEAHALDGSNQTAAALLGLTQLINVTEKSGSQSFMDTLGMEAGGRNVYDWRAGIQDEEGEIVLPTNYNFTQIASFWQSTLVPESESARANLGLVTNPNFLLTLSAAETNMPVSLNIDYADILMARACLRAAEFLAHLGSGQNLNLNLEALQNVMSGNLFSLQKVLADNPDFLTTGSTVERAAAKAALQDMIALYRQASVAVRARPAGLERLFMLDADALVEEAGFRQMLDTIERSLTEPVEVGTGYLYAGPLFESSWTARAVLPVFTATGFDALGIPDASLGGVATGFTKEKIAAALADKETVPDLGWEWVSPKPQGNTMWVYTDLPGGKHLAMGDAGSYLTSSDGVTWTPQRLAGVGPFYGVARHENRVVAVTERGSIHVSDDAAVSWRQVYTSGDSNFHGIVYGGGRFVAVGEHGQILISTDGEAWDEIYVNGSFALWKVCYTGSNYVAVGVDSTGSNSVILTSPDGYGWTTRYNAALPGGASVNDVAANGNTVVAVGSVNSRLLSTDGGVNWTTGTVLVTPPANLLLSAVTYNNGVFVTVGTSGTVATSADGVTWTAATTGESFLSLRGVGLGGDGRTYVVAAGGVVLRSADNATFSRSITGFQTAGSITNPAIIGLSVIAGKLYAGTVQGSGSTGGSILQSTDGVTFTNVSTGHADIWDIMEVGGTYYAAGNGGTILTSTNGTTWTAQTTGFATSIRSISSLGGKLMVTGNGGMIRVWNPSNSTWELKGGGLVFGVLYDVAYGNGTYVAVGGNNAGLSHVLTSPDGNTWTVRNPGTGETFRSIVFHDGVFTAVGSNGAISRSTDGINWWWAGSSDITTNLTSITVIDGRYYVTVVVAGNNASLEAQAAVLISSDAESWLRVPLGTNLTPNRLVQFAGRLYTGNNGAGMLRSRSIAAVANPTTQPLTPDTTAQQGDTLALVVNVSSDGVTTYQWKKDNVDVEGATGPGLTLGNIQSSDAGSYTLVVTNATGVPVTSAPIVVAVSATPKAPVFLSHPYSLTQNVGLNASLSVEVSGTTPISFVWKKDGVTVSNGGNISGADTAELSFTGVTAANGGTYVAYATNTAGTAESLPAVLTVDSNVAYNFTTLAGLAFNTGTTDGTGSGARFNTPHGVAVSATGDVYVSSSISHTIRKITSGGVVTTIAGQAGVSGGTDATGTAASFNGPRGLALNAGGTVLYVADTNNNRIRKIDLSNNAVTTLTSSTNSPTALVVDSSDNVYYTSWDHTVRKVTPAAVISIVAGAGNNPGTLNGTAGAARFNGPMGIAMDSSGNLYIADSNNAMIRKITMPSAVVTTYAGQPQGYGYTDGPADSATFSSPSGIAVDSIGNVFVADNSSGVIRKISPTRQVTTIGGQAYWGGYSDGIGSDARFNAPAGLAVNSAGTLHFAENYNHVIRRGAPLGSPSAPVVSAPVSRTVSVGDSVTFSVLASGVSTLTYQWRHNGVDIGGEVNSSLTLTNVQASQAGSYSVLVHSVGEGDALSAAATLTVTAPPVISGQPSNQNVATGQAVNLSVTATASGDVSYQWRRNGFEIAGANGSSFSIPTAQRGDAGIYDVVINGVGGTRTSAPSVVQVAPTSYPGSIAFDPSFSSAPLLTTSCRIFTTIALPGGKWMVGGEFVRWGSTPRTFLARLNADYSLDTTFAPPAINGFVYALGLGADGVIYVGGEFTHVNGHAVPGLFRLTPAGVLDLNWRVQDSPPNASVTALAVQPDGKVLVARAATISTQTSITGTSTLRRMNADGTADGTFSVNITNNNQRLNAITVEPSTGKIAFAGNFAQVNGTTRAGAARVDATGATLDTTFGGATGVAAGSTVFSMTLLPSGKYLLGGTFGSVGGTPRNRAAIINADGTLDGFAPVALNGNVLGAAQQSDGKVILAGTFSTANAQSTDGLVRLTVAGAVDTSYPSGANTSSFSTISAVRTAYIFPQTDGSMAIFGSFQAALNQRRIGVAVVSAGGSLAPTPSTLLYRPAYVGSAFPYGSAQSIAVGSIDVAGPTGSLKQMVRMNDDGTLDSSFPVGAGVNPNGLSTFYVYRAVQQGDGKVVMVGDIVGYDNNPAYRMARMNADGSFDGSFNTGGGPSTVLAPLVALSGGKTIVYGLNGGSTFNGQVAPGMVRLNVDGSRDDSFALGAGFGHTSLTASISAVCEQADGKLLVAGTFNLFNNVSVPAFIRLNLDGTRDTTFAPGTAQNATIVSIVQLPDGKIMVAGAFTTFNGSAANRAVLLTSTGAIDGSFTAPAGLDGTVGQVLPQEDGKFILIGDFTGTPTPNAVRLAADGSIDSSFALRGITNGFNSGTRIFMGGDGSIYAYSGNPVSYNNNTPVAYARFRGAATAPTVVLEPQSVTAASGSTVTLSVRANGTGPFTYQWRRNGQNIDGATYSVLTLSNVTDTADYDVVITNSVTSTTSGVAHITLPAPFLPFSKELAGGQGAYSIMVNLAGNWSASVDQPWATLSRTTGNGGGPIDVRVLANSSGGDRTATITIGGVAHTLTQRVGSASTYSLWGLGAGYGNPLGQVTAQSRASVVTTGVVDAAAGGVHTLLLKTDGTLWAYGDNSSGQLGDGTTIYRAAPVQIATGVSKLAAGFGHSAFVKTDGTLWTVGDNDFGQLGDGSNVDKLTPVQIATGVAAVAAGDYTTVFVKTDGTLWACGYNANGQLGDGTTTSRSAPVQVATGVATALAAGYHTVFVKTDGSLWGMGDNSQGQLGDGSNTGRLSPVAITTGVSKVAAGDYHTLFLKTNGSLWSTGRNFNGELGDGTNTNRNVPLQIATGVTELAGGLTHTLFVKSDGTLWGVGSNNRGELGDGSYTSRNTPVQITTGVSKVAATESHSVFVTTDGKAWTMGDNNSGQLGYKSLSLRQPVQVRTGVTAAAAGLNHSLFISADGTLWGQGENNAGQLGDGTTQPRNGPVQVATDVSKVAAGLYRSYFIKTDATLWAMGQNTLGQLGDGTTTQRNTPVQVATGVAQVAASMGNHALFIKTDGTLWANGRNNVGQLGDGTTTQRNTPIQVPGSGTVIAAAVGQNASLFIKSDGSLWGMGQNTSGQLGDGTVVNKSTPVQITTGVAAVAASYTSSYFVKTDGTLWAMGNNVYGQLGDGTTVNKSTPVQIATDVSSLAGFADGLITYVMFVKTDGSLWATGRDYYGYGSANASTTPVQIASGGVVSVSGGDGFALFMAKNDGSYVFLATPAITWTTPAPITEGTALGATQLSATTGVAGTFNYSPAAGTVLAVGTHTLSATFTPTDLTAYTSVTVTRSLTVNAASGFATWQSTNFTSLELADANISGPNAVFGQDGLPNLVKYTLGLNPKVNATSGLPEVTTTATDWVYTFTKPASVTDVTCVVKTSTNLTTWTTSGVTLTLVSTVGGVETWQAKLPLTTANAFFRLEVTQ